MYFRLLCCFLGVFRLVFLCGKGKGKWDMSKLGVIEGWRKSLSEVILIGMLIRIGKKL